MKAKTRAVNEAFSCVIQDDEDKDFEPPSIRVDEEYETSSQLNTTSTEKEKAYPKVQVRYSFKDFNENVIRVTIQIAADYTLPIQTAIMVIRDVAYGIFGQNYDVELDYKEKNTQSDNENDEIDNESVENATGKKSKRRMDYTYVMPLSRTVRRYLEDANLLQLKYLADRILSNPDEDVVTLGLDNTTKAAGNKVHDVKTTHFTFKGPESSPECFTIGFHENASHAGKEAAKQVTCIFSMMATLAECTLSEIKEAIDSFIVDRAADTNLTLKELGIEDEMILKCTAHICLWCDAVIDKIFRQKECEIGTNKLLDVSAGTQHFGSPSTSIFKFFDAISIETPPGDPSVASQVDRAVPNVSNNTLVKLEHAPQTNLRCESSFSLFDSMVGKCSGGTSIKRVVSQDKFLVRPKLERKELWSWARKSEESVKARRIEEDMLKTICNVKKMALEVKMQKKKKKLLQKIKAHGGPVTPNTINVMLPQLTSKELILEISYLRAVACIKQRKRHVLSRGRE